MRLTEQRLSKLLIISSLFCISQTSYSETAAPAAEATKQAVEVAKQAEPTVDVIKHKATKSIANGKRLTVKAKLSGKNGIKTARVYFKSQAGGKYNFVVMNEVGPNIYEAELPATAEGTKGIDYKIVAQDAMGEVHKTSKFSVPVESVTAGSDVAAANQGFIDVFSEYPQDLTNTTGFSDAIRYTYDATKIGGSSGGLIGGLAAGNATTATANAATLSNLGWAGVGVGAVAAGGAVAAAASDSGGSDPVDEEALNAALNLDPCYDGLVQVEEVDTRDGSLIETSWYKFENGFIVSTAYVVYWSETGCDHYNLEQLNPRYTDNSHICINDSHMRAVLSNWDGDVDSEPGDSYVEVIKEVSSSSCPLVSLSSSHTSSPL